MPKCSRGFIHLNEYNNFIHLQSYYNHDNASKTMEFVLGEAILSFIGRFYLYLRFRNKEKVQQELTRKYEGQFSNAGIVLLADIFMALAIVAVVALIAAVLYSVAA